jgi:hypothetical protein
MEKGPNWVIKRSIARSEEIYNVVQEGQPENRVLLVYVPPTKENALKIAAVNEMLEALKVAQHAARSFRGLDYSELEQIDAAIAKAEGRS